ncbi:MAG: head GIN domain-containing protein [Bacteroidota bacterium]|nr:head GIN domain-containing protein [Bacteroidota bacterium]MDP4212750.1 head GIN domain-containing protein [Bacteroidota bacterium]MDP4249345.1 head GIN domain-containing protein [Bacteroidota bacterium]
MKKFLFPALAVLSVLAGTAQSSDNDNLQARTVGAFHGISVSGGINLYIQSGPQSVSVSASDVSSRDHIITEVEDGILKIYMEKGYSGSRDKAKLKAFVSLTALSKLSASGGSDTYLQTAFSVKDLEVNLSGGSNLKGKLSADDLFIRQSGGSDVDLSGMVKSLTIKASGGSDLHGFDLITDHTSIEASGGSKAHVTVNKELKVVASGGSDVFYKGAATVSEMKSSGSSSVVKKG